MKLTPKQQSVLAVLGVVSKNEIDIAKAAGIQTMWPHETARKHCMALRKLGLAREIKTRFCSVWQITEAGRAILSDLHAERAKP